MDEMKANWDWFVEQPDWLGEMKAMEDALGFAAAPADLIECAPRLAAVLESAEHYLEKARIYRRFMVERERKDISTAGPEAMIAKANCEAAIALLEPRIEALRIILGFGAREGTR